MSEKSIPEKLRITAKTALWIADPGRLALLGPLPEGARLVAGLGDATLAVAFADDAASLRAILAAHGKTLATVPVVWIAYPKGNRADINRDTLWPMLAEVGLRPNGQVAIDDTWSALRFRILRAGEAPFASRS